MEIFFPALLVFFLFGGNEQSQKCQNAEMCIYCIYITPGLGLLRLGNINHITPESKECKET